MKKIVFSAALAIMSMPFMSGQNFDPAKKLIMAERLINSYYVDSIPESNVVEKAIVAMLKTLDPHSLYSDAAETKELTTPLQGNFSGIGIQFNMLNDTLYVIQTIAGGPSEKVGLRAGDRILSANDSIISGVKRQNSSVMGILRGPKGTPVNVRVLRRGEAEPIDFRIIRDDIPMESVDVAYMADPTTGYIKVTRFAETTPEEFRRALEKLKKQGMSNLIIDLEDNGGGYMGAAVDLASEFLKKGDVVVSTKAPRMGSEVDYDVKKPGVMQNGRLVVMVNQYSASASEILSGAIQDNDRGLIVGRRTFGKGLVQRPFPFPDGSMIRLTVARYFTPSGRTIQKPYTKGEGDQYELDMLNRYESGEFMNADSIHFADSLKTETLRNRRTIYGGGGIMPDVFVPVDTTGYSRYYRDLVAKGILNRYCIEYVDNHREQLRKTYKTEEAFINQFEVSGQMTDDLIKMATGDSIKYDPEQFSRSRETIETIMKGLIGRGVFDNSTYSRVVNKINPVFREALGLINDKQRYSSLLTGEAAK